MNGMERIGMEFQESSNTPLQHTSGNPPSQLWKESLYSLLGNGLGVCSKGVLKQPWKNGMNEYTPEM